MEAWELTPGELCDYIEVFRRRMEIQSYWGYNLAQCIASMVLSSTRPKPCDAFPGWIQREEMTDEESLTSRCFGLMTSKIDKYYSGYIDNYAAGVSVNMGSAITASVPITDAIKGQNFYICLCASNKGQNVITTSTWEIYKIWFS